jgi:hypothetical protein
MGQGLTQDSALRQLHVLVVAESRQLVDHAVLRVGEVQQSESEGHYSSDGQLAVVQKMLEGPQSHLRTYLLAHRRES